MSNQPPNSQQRHNQHTPRDPQKILGLAPGATREQINAAYRHALRHLHPDTRPPNPTNDANNDTHADRAKSTTTAPLTAELTMADLQHARRELLRTEQQQRAEPGRGDANAWARDRPEPPIRPGMRGYHPDVGEPDIICGPVRYHGPPTRSC